MSGMSVSKLGVRQFFSFRVKYSIRKLTTVHLHLSLIILEQSWEQSPIEANCIKVKRETTRFFLLISRGISFKKEYEVSPLNYEDREGILRIKE